MEKKPDPSAPDEFKLEILKRKAKALQGSVNYWQGATRFATAKAEKHHGTEWQNHYRARIEAFKQRADEAGEELAAVRDELTRLDPGGTTNAKTRSLRTNIGRRTNELAQLEKSLIEYTSTDHEDEAALIATRRMIDKRRAKLEELKTELREHVASTRANHENQLRERERLTHLNEATTARQTSAPALPWPDKSVQANAGISTNSRATKPENRQPNR